MAENKENIQSNEQTQSNDYKRKHEKWGTMEKQGLVVGRGDNKRVIPPDEVYKLACLYCSYQEIADWFEIPRETLKYNFRDLIQKGYNSTKQGLRRAQIEVAMKGNVSMLIWLGKNMLGQSDNPMESGDQTPLPWTDEQNLPHNSTK
jgi:Fe-S oxidoreductase